MAKITQASILAAQAKNALKKIQEGKSLTATETKVLKEWTDAQEQPDEQKQDDVGSNRSIRTRWISMAALSGGLGIPIDILKRAKQKGCSAFKLNGTINLSEWLRWHFAQVTGDLETYDDARTRETRERANLLEIKRKELEGELVPRDMTEALIAEWVAPVSQRLRSQPDRLAPLVNPADPEHAREVLLQERKELFGLGWLAGEKKAPAKKAVRKRAAKKATTKRVKKTT